MSVDMYQLRRQARQLGNLYHQLHQLKYQTGPTPEIKTHQPAGPRPPANWLYLACYITQEQKLREVAFNAFQDLGIRLTDNDTGAHRLCQLIGYHAQAISELEWASDFQDEIEDQIRIITNRCKDTLTVPNTPQDTWLTARTICYKLRPHVTPDLLRKWAQRGKIRHRKGHPHNTYPLGDVLKQLHNTSNEQQPQSQHTPGNPI